jgi:hypothetical protein
VDEFVELGKQESNAKGEKDSIKEILTDYVIKHDLMKLFGNKHKISISSLENISIKDKETLKVILEKL